MLWHLKVPVQQAKYLHAQFRTALANRNLRPEDHGLPAIEAPSAKRAANPSHEVIDYGETFAVPREQYDKVTMPAATNLRHHHLDSVAKSIIRIGEENSHKYKLAMCGMAAILAQLNIDEPDMQAGTQALPSVAPPPTKKARATEKEKATTMQVCIRYA